MSKHTPGPWIGAGPSFGDPLPRYMTEIVTEWEDEDDERVLICALPFHHHDDENEANARLIEAAPEMLEDTQITNEQELGGFEHWTPEFQAYFEQWLRTEYVPRVIQYYLMKYVY